MRYLVLSIFLVLAFTTCSDDDLNPNGVEFRVRNNSDQDFQVITSNDFEFGSLSAGSTSPYVFLDGMYRYGYTLIVSEGDTSILQPIDFVGETYLTEGKYTYEFDFEDSAPPYNVSLQFVED